MSDPTTESTQQADLSGLVILRLMWEAHRLTTPDSGVTEDEQRADREANAINFLHKDVHEEYPGSAKTYIATVNSRPEWNAGAEIDGNTLKAVERMARNGHIHNHGSGQSSGSTGTVRDIPSMSSIEPFSVTSLQLYTCEEDVPTDTILRQIFAKVIAEDEVSFHSSPEQVGQAENNDAAETPVTFSFTVDLATEPGHHYNYMVTAVTYVFTDSPQIVDSGADDADESSDEDLNSQGDVSDNGEPAEPEGMGEGVQ
ncbi:hypothetical protein JCM24511_01455 [Saitozyma sp. JCM 24511]|nr:hypothetical protein JCM24511_01455 [Saitozyma sp. JCM 24511]